MPEQQRKSETEQFSPGYARYVLGVLFLVYVFNFIDRQILSILIDPPAGPTAACGGRSSPSV